MERSACPLRSAARTRRLGVSKVETTRIKISSLAWHVWDLVVELVIAFLGAPKF